MKVNTKSVDKKAMSLCRMAQKIVVTDNKSYDRAGEALKTIKTLQKEIRATFKPVKDAIRNSLMEAQGAEQKHLAPTEEAERLIKGVMNDYYQDQQRLKYIEEEKIRKAELRQEEIRIKAAKKKKPVPFLKPVPIVHTVIPKAKGIVQKKKWKWKVEDFDMLPKEYKMDVANERKIQSEVSEQKDRCKIKGVKIWEETLIAAGSN